MFDFIIDGLNKIKDEVVNGTETALETIGNIVDVTLDGVKKEVDILKSDDNEPKSE